MARIKAPAKTPLVSAAPIVVAYMRFSTTGQMDGTSEDRQRENNEGYAARHNMPIDRTYFDQGASAFHETHIKGEYGRMLADIASGSIPRDSKILVESLDRLSRSDTIMASNRFTSLLVAGMTIITTMDGKVYNRFSDQIVGDFFGATGHQIGNHQASKDKSGRMVASHQKRRGTISAVMPSWIVKHRDVQPVTTVKNGKQITRTQAVTTGISVDETRAAIVRQMFRDFEVMGVNKMCQVMNRDGKRTANGKPWIPSAVLAIVRGRTALGEQEVFRHQKVDGKMTRIRNGDPIKNAYPAIVTEGEWYAANAAIDARQRGSVIGRHSNQGFPNLFGSLARCEYCNGYVSIRQKARANTSCFKYLGCTNASVGTCEARHFHRLDQIEATFLKFWAEPILGETPAADDPATPILATIANMTAEIAKLEASLSAMVAQFSGEMAGPIGKAITGLADNIRDKQSLMKREESKLAHAKSAKPATEQYEALRALIASLDGVEGGELAVIRSKIANLLPTIVKSVRLGWDHIEGSASTGTKRVRLRKTPAPPVPVSRIGIELVNELPATLPHNAAGNFVRHWQRWGNGFYFRDGRIIQKEPRGTVGRDFFGDYGRGGESLAPVKPAKQTEVDTAMSA